MSTMVAPPRGVSPYGGREGYIALLCADAEHMGRVPSSEEWTADPERPSATAVRNNFGSWNALVRAAGFTPRPSPAEHRWNPLVVLQLYRADAARLNEPPSRSTWNATPHRPAHSVVVRHFGSWNAFVRAAGFEPRPSPEEREPDWPMVLLVRLYREDYERLGRVPTLAEWVASRERPSNSVIHRRGGMAAIAHLAGIAPRRAGWTRTSVPNARIAAAYIESGRTASSVARDLDWWRRSHRRGRTVTVPDGSRVRRVLGLAPRAGRGPKTQRSIRYELAISIVDALGVDPVDVGL